MPAEFYIYVVSSPTGHVNAVSFLPHEHVFVKGLKIEAITGWLLPGTGINQESFKPNRRFVELLHRVIATYAPTLPGLQDEAQRIGEGSVFVIDGRAPTPRDAVDPEDIIGAFPVAAGIVLSESYQASPNHLLLNKHGWFVLNPQLQDKLIEELYRIAS